MALDPSVVPECMATMHTGLAIPAAIVVFAFVFFVLMIAGMFFVRHNRKTFWMIYVTTFLLSVPVLLGIYFLPNMLYQASQWVQEVLR